MIQSGRNALNSISDKRRKSEIAGVLLTGSGKFIFMDFLEWKFLFIAISIILWMVYVIDRNKQVPGILKYWGFRTDNFIEVSLLILPFGIISVVSFIVVGYSYDTLNISWHIIPVLILYPVWGTIQQFLVVGLVAGNLQDMKNAPDKFVIITVTAILFGLLHYPYYWLMFGTFVLALLYGFIYLRYRNVYVMGLFHGWLGGLFFYTVVGRDPFAEVFGRLIH